MTVEAATYIADLQAVNPPSTDPRSQGDDHLRLIKQVLQNTFAGASRQFQIPSAFAASTNTTLTKGNGEWTIYISTASGAVTITLPSLTSIDAGWKVRFVKTTSDVNPVFIAPPSGTLNSGGVAGLSKARRCIPGVTCEAIWDGTSWFVTRALALPIGSCIEYHGGSLPAGYEWPNGQVLSSAANYPEYNAWHGGLGTVDRRGYVGVCLDNLGGSSAGRLSGGVITGTGVGNTGGVDVVSLAVAHIPNLSVSGSASFSPGQIVVYPGGNSSYTVPISSGAAWAGLTLSAGSFFNYGAITAAGGSGPAITYTASFSNVSTLSGSSTGTATGSGTTVGANHSNLQPSIMVSQILVVE